MNSLVVVTLLAAIAIVNADVIVPSEHKEKAMKIAAECRTESGLSDEDYAKLKNGDDLSANENARCFTNCFQEKIGVIKDNVFQEASALEKFSKSLGEDKAKQIAEACRGESGSGKCETAYKLHVCFKKNNAY